MSLSILCHTCIRHRQHDVAQSGHQRLSTSVMSAGSAVVMSPVWSSREGYMRSMWASGLLKTNMLILDSGPYVLVVSKFAYVNVDLTVSEDLRHKGHFLTYLAYWYGCYHSVYCLAITTSYSESFRARFS